MENTFFARFQALCKQNGTTVNAVAKLLEISSGSVTAWKRGTQPRSGTLARIADHFDVTADFLLGGEDAPAPDVLDQVDVAWYGDFKALTEDQKQTVRDMVALMRQRRNS